MNKNTKVPEKVKSAVKLLSSLGKKPKGSSIDIINQIESLGYDWDNDGKIWINIQTQTKIMVVSDVTIIDELLENIMELIQNFESADLELKSIPVIYQAKNQKKQPMENMKQFYLVYQNNSLENEVDMNRDIDVESIINEDEDE